jgi:TPR repeat protein
MNELGVCYVTGHGVDLDLTEAVAWFRKAAAAGDVQAQFNLGLVYLRGKGVEKDYRQAYEWLARAASAGDPVTVALRDKVGELLEAESKKLRAEASRLGVEPEELAIAAVLDLLNRSDDFRDAARYVLRKNKELYQRLS